METKVSSATKEVIISDNGPTTLIGERINPTGKKKLQEALKNNDLDYVEQMAITQVEAGADILDVNVSTSGVDEIVMLPKTIERVMSCVDAPLCIDINNPAALKGALEVYKGKPIVNSVNGEENSLNEVLPLVKEYGTAVIGLTMDEEGIPKTADKRVAVAHKIVERADKMGIPTEDIIIDCLALTLGADSNAALVTIDAISRIKKELGVNQTLGASNISFGLPERNYVNHTFLTLAIYSGMTCPTVNAAHVRTAILSIDLALGRDRFAQRYMKHIRSLKSK